MQLRKRMHFILRCVCHCDGIAVLSWMGWGATRGESVGPGWPAATTPTPGISADQRSLRVALNL